MSRWAPLLGLVDRPAAGKVHLQPKPTGGGLAIYVAVAVTACVHPDGLSARLLLVLGMGAVVVLLSLIDDLRPLLWHLGLTIQTLAACVAVLRWPEDMGWLTRGLGVFWVVVPLNALDILDNMDALSGGVAWIAAGFLALGFYLRAALGTTLPALPFLVLRGTLFDFLWFNRPHAQILWATLAERSLASVSASAALMPPSLTRARRGPERSHSAC